MPPQILYGDASRQFSTDILKPTLTSLNIRHIDTAARYQHGESEKALGAANLAAEGFKIDTEILVSDASGDGSLSPSAIRCSLENSLKVLKVDKVHTLYAHSPDNCTPLLETAEAFDELFRAGKFEKLGVSNFSLEMLQEWLNLSERHDLVKPTVFQGQYNLLCRTYEDSLFPMLRENGISFVAYSPLAHGFLLGTFTKGIGERDFPEASPMKKWYDHASMHEAVKMLGRSSKRTGLSMSALSLRWLMFHSGLQLEDAVIIGGSKAEYVEDGMKSMKAGPLDDDVVQELGRLWEGVKYDAHKIVL